MLGGGCSLGLSSGGSAVFRDTPGPQRLEEVLHSHPRSEVIQRIRGPTEDTNRLYSLSYL